MLENFKKIDKTLSFTSQVICNMAVFLSVVALTYNSETEPEPEPPIIKSLIFFLFHEGNGNESCNLIGSLRGPDFPISDDGHGNGGKQRG